MPRVRSISFGLALLAWIFCPAVPAAEPSPWIEVDSAHFTVITDAGEKKGREVALRFEQMRTVFGVLLGKERLNQSIPLTILAFRNDKSYYQVAPLTHVPAITPGQVDLQPIDVPGFFLPGDDQDFIVLNLFEEESWRAVAHDFAEMLLGYNYPPAQGWFDEGLAEYFSTIRVDNKQVELGGDPELRLSLTEDLLGNQHETRPPKSLTELLGAQVWLPLPDLFALKHDPSTRNQSTHHTLYYAESWIVMHYLLHEKKLPETGAYFNLVLNQHVPVEDAIQKAYGMSSAQMEQAVKDYFKTQGMLGVALDQSKKPVVDPVDIQQPDHFAPPFSADDVRMEVAPVKDDDAEATIGDVMARLPERRDQALHDLQQLAADPKDNEVADRGLAWEYIRHQKFDAAATELEKAGELNQRDPWIWYYRAALKYRKAQATRQEIQGLANTMQDLHAFTDWYPDCADAYNMLAMARVEGGGNNSALEAERQAIALSPRNVEYQFNLGQIYVASKKWDLARDVFTRLREGADRQAAAAAKLQLEDLDTLQKYGVRPQRAGESETPAGAASTPAAGTGAASKSAGATSAKNEGDDEDAPPKPAPARPGTTGPVLFLKGKIVSSDCSKAPEATVTILSGMTTYKMHAADYKSLPVIGEDQFSCEWTNRLVSVNYRAVGKNAGELVSLEVR